MNLRSIVLVPFSVALILLGSTVAEACRCIVGVNPCGFYRAEGGVAFIGTVSEVVESKEKSGQPINGTTKRITIKVDEMLKGSLPSHVFISDDGLRPCNSFPFALGKTYLVYSSGVLDGRDNILPVALCSGTALAENSQDSIAFLRQIRNGSMPSVLYGSVRRVLSGENNSAPMPNLKVVLAKIHTFENGRYKRPKKSDRRFEALTDADGNYRFENLAIGEYKLEPQLPPDLWIPETRALAVGGGPYCQNSSFTAFPNGSVSGRVVHADGTPASRLSVFVMPLNRETRYYYGNGLTDENGNFTLPGLSEGSYKVYASLQGYQRDDTKPSLFDTQYPFWSWFFPNTFDVEQAQPIRIAHAESVQNIRLKMPPMPVKRTIIGSVKWGDGTKLNKAIVSYRIRKGAETFHPRAIEVDSDGGFSFEIFGEFDYEVMAQNNHPTIRALSGWQPIPKGENGHGITLVLRSAAM